MCILCVLAGKASGGDGCGEAGSAPVSAVDPAIAKDDVAAAPPPGDVAPDFQSPASDTVPGSASTGLALSDDLAVRGFVNTSGDQDWYRVTLVAGHQYTFALNGFGGGAIEDPFLRVLNAAGSELASDDDNGPLLGSRLTFTASATGIYYISAGGFGTSTGQYMLTMNEGTNPFVPAVSVGDVADYLTNSYWEVNGSRDRHWGASPITVNLAGLEAERAVLARLALQTWSEVANLTFVETTAAAKITFDDNQSGAFSSSSFTSAGLITSSIINVQTSWYGGIDSVDSYTLQTFIHEIGHALGLGHGGPYNGSATYGVDNVYANDSWQLSLMSYMDQSDYGSATYRFVMTPQMGDILAIQQIYGAATTRSADTVYGFGSTAGFLYDFAFYSQAPALTIYDSGGTDALNASNYGHNQRIDLRPGSFSNIGGLTGNIGVYLTSVIENAFGGSGSDTIFGNDADNTLRGGGGNDTIDGGTGLDFAVFSGSRSSYTLTSLGGTSVRVAGTDGTDTLTNVERLVFDDQTISWPLVTQPDLRATNLALGSTSLAAGSGTELSYTIGNNGNGAAGASTTGIFGSVDATFDGSDTLLTTRAAPALAAGGSASDSLTLTLTATGTYFIFAVADYTNTVNDESDDGNNSSNGAQISVVSVPSPTVPGPTPPSPVSLNGGPGNDTLISAGGDETINGNAGDDTAVFSYSLSSYALTDLGLRITVSGPDGNDTLIGIEHLRFADGTINILDGSGVFDTVFYDRNNIDVFHAMDARAHYNAHGWREGRDPNAFFTSSGYLAANPDVRAAGMNPLDQYHQGGWREGRDPGPDFDTRLYLIHNPDVAAAGMDPLEHYLQYGRAEGRAAYAATGSNIVGGFDGQYYLFHNPDVARAGMDPLQHFNLYGRHEGRNPNAFFDTAGYLSHNPDVMAAGMNPLQHYEAYGWLEGRDPSPWFDTDAYLTAYPDVAAAHMNPLDHYLNYGIYEGRSPFNDGVWQS